MSACLVVALAACAKEGATPTPPAATAKAPEAPGDDTPRGPEAKPKPSPPEQSAATWTFDDSPSGSLPPGWSAPFGKWSVEVGEDAPSGTQVLVQKAANRSAVFNVALIDDTRHADIDVQVRMRALKGRIDQGGGIVWRASDAENYYIARYNPLEDNYRLYHVKDGKRLQLASADVELDHAAWHTVRVRMAGDHIQGFLDGKQHFDVRDTTFGEPGKVGLWTKADARTQFDDLRVQTASEATSDGVGH